MGCANIFIAVFFQIQAHEKEKVDGFIWMPILGLSLFVFMFSLGIGSVAWIMMGELFSPDIRGIAAAFGSTINYLLGFIVVYTFNIMQESIGTHGSFWVFTGFCFLGVIWVFLFVPETKGLSLEEIQKIFYEKKIFMFLQHK